MRSPLWLRTRDTGTVSKGRVLRQEGDGLLFQLHLGFLRSRIWSNSFISTDVRNFDRLFGKH